MAKGVRRLPPQPHHQLGGFTMLSVPKYEYEALIKARKAVAGWEPVPYQLVKECGESAGMRTSAELVAAVVMLDEFATEAAYLRVFNRTVELLDNWNGESGLWW